MNPDQHSSRPIERSRSEHSQPVPQATIRKKAAVTPSVTDLTQARLSQGDRIALQERDTPKGLTGTWNNIFYRSVFAVTLGYNLVMNKLAPKRQWFNQVDSTIVLGALPFPKAVRKLADQGVKGVVNTCAEFKGPRALYRKLGMEQLYIPTIDFTSPKLSDVIDAVDFIASHKQQGDKVYIHCKAGRGRSATIALAWLMFDQGLNPSEAQQELEKMRPHVNKKLAERPCIIEFYNRCKNKDAAPPNRD